jgi:hypothetical protein
MANEIKIVTSGTQQPFAASGAVGNVQTTGSSESLGVPADKQATGPDPSVMSFLTAEGDGTPHALAIKHPNNYGPAEAITGALVIIIIIINFIRWNNRKQRSRLSA